MKSKIAITEGDGVGPEVIKEAKKILRVISDYSELQFEFQEAPAGGEVWKKYGTNLPDKSYRVIKNADALLFGAVGLPDLAPGVAESAILKIRQGLDLYINLRPIKLYEPLKSICPLKADFIGKGIDMYIIRENTEGLYANIGGILREEVAINNMIYTRKGCERVIKYAFEFAKRRKHNKITSVDKANILKPSQLWRNIFTELGNKFPNINQENIYIDAFCQWLIRAPYSYETVVTGNLFGDIISDEGAFLIGSLGMASSGNIHPGETSMYEPIHGSAPDIAGKNVANPIGAILSVKLMLEESFKKPDIGDAIEQAVIEAIKEGRTQDIKEKNQKTLTTADMGDLIKENLKSILKR
ncbi:MAG: 3-isopropylmalate dehydrogenase [Candidatus Lokiarchaeota archaeon]|nr:3-isopropylmalate dehydrogenase [Candidatus Lokiarchaeota archaeon]MBD3201463.1 3-isopropylmalate dehydrogenase [Candidatus Lokiarchaeota archaeon]